MSSNARYRALAGLAALAAVLGCASPAAALSSPKTFSGAVPHAGCTYSVTASWSDQVPDKGNLTGSLMCGTRVSLTVTGSWDGTTVTIGTLNGSFDSHRFPSQNINQSVSLPDDPTVDLSAFTEDFAGKALSAAESAALTSPATFGPKSFAGGKCTYRLQASWSGTDISSGTLAGTVACGSDLSVQLTATWNGTDVQLGQISATILGQTVSKNLDEGIGMSFDGALDLDDLVDALAGQVPSLATDVVTRTSFAGLDDPSALAAQGSLPSDVLTGLQALCHGVHVYGDPSAVCHNGYAPLPKSITPPGPTLGPQAVGYDRMDDSQAGACPQMANNPPPKLFVICVPTYVAGDFDAGRKDIVLMPGGALLAAPVGGGLAGPTTPEIKTSGSILLFGGAIGGVNLKLVAGGSVGIAGTFVSMFGSLEIDAHRALKIGELDTRQLLGYVPQMAAASGGGQEFTGTGANLVYSYLGQALPATVTLPVQLWAAKVKLMSGALSIQSRSVVSADGLGQPGAAFYGPVLFKSGPYGGGVAGGGGAYSNYGGSHIGYGGYPTNWPLLNDIAYGPGPRGRVFDSPFDPSRPGGGGGGANDSTTGASGGGVVAIDSSSLSTQGTVRADGDSVGTPKGCLCGGGGAGGAIDVHTGALTGNGAFEANGGGGSNGPGQLGGFGGGGAVALHYTSQRFRGPATAHGGLVAPQSSQPLLHDLGGAGTVFLQQTKRAPSAPKSAGDRAKPGGGSRPAAPSSTAGGTLIIDGGSDSAWPATDPTPLPNGWSEKDRTLVVRGYARVYASDAKFAKISLSGGGVLGAAAGTRTLKLTAGEIGVGASARIDISGHGYAGGQGASDPTGTATSASGATPSKGRFGGSHGGKGGGLPSWVGTAGSTYDRPSDPKLPGGGGGGASPAGGGIGTFGGGVLLLTASTLDDNGVIAADGQDADGPTASFPFQWEGTVAAGAGGALQIHARTLTGAGSIEARGGDVNLPDSQKLAAGFSEQADAGGGGGGGDILVVAPAHRNFRGHITAAGGVDFTDTAANGATGVASRP